MGGFHFYDNNRPLHPLSPNHVVELVKRGRLVPPTTEEILDKSKGDAPSKGVALIQALWFVAQCIARRAAQLPITSLEVMTLAYTVITVAMYTAWWYKPLNVGCAVRVPKEKITAEKVAKFDSIWERFFQYVMGSQDDYTDLRQRNRVPIFWAGGAGQDEMIYADIIALLVAMVFGAIHCIAWSSEFESQLEQQLWRSSAIAIIATPAALVVAILLVVLIDRVFHINGTTGNFLMGIFYSCIAVIYIASRLILVVLSFTTLRRLPLSAYRTVQWTTFIPHI